MTNEEPKIIGTVRELKETMQPLEIRMHFPAIAEALILAYEALEYGKVMMKDDITIVPTDPPRECMWFTYKAIDEALSRISSLPA